MKKIQLWYKGLADNSKAMLIFISTILIAVIIFLLASMQMSREAKKALKPYLESQELITNYLDSLKKPQQLPEKYFKLFKTQQKILSYRKAHYMRMSRLFFRNYYGVLIITMLYSCIGGVVLFLLINKGWAPSHSTIKALFLAIVLVVTFCGFFPAVFKQQENFNENISYFSKYIQAEGNIVYQLSKLENPTYAMKTVKDSLKNTSYYILDSTEYFNRVDSMITINNNTINSLTNYILSIDEKELKNIDDVYKIIATSIGKKDSTIPNTP